LDHLGHAGSNGKGEFMNAVLGEFHFMPGWALLALIVVVAAVIVVVALTNRKPPTG